MDRRVYIAFGFHVNLYHSFRGDSNDERGFGEDIRIIRHILDVLDSLNNKGIDVRGTWDFENAYSLEKILPRYAPDIMQRVRHRVLSGRDEIILMSYNNGMSSCMNEKELSASVEWTISNKNGSGIMDIFGSYRPVVRPQEMFFTPSNLSVYKKLGIKALCIYYSSVPFDGFRTLIPLLPLENAFNPLTYRHGENDAVILPMISHADLPDFISLKGLVKKLHRKQLNGEIRHDVLVHINMDADAVLWYGLKLPAYLNWLPNTNGLEGLVKNVASLDYVSFITPGSYLDTHTPLKEITFNQDIADGSFDGYSSWSERPFNQFLWSRIERARQKEKKLNMLLEQKPESPIYSEARELAEESFRDRMLLLSTTHFGLSTPVLNMTREKRAVSLSQSMLEKAEKACSLAEYPSFNRALNNTSSIPVIVYPQENSIVNITADLAKGCVSRLGFMEVTNADGELLPFALLDLSRHSDGSISQLKVLALLPSAHNSKTRINIMIKTERARRTESAVHSDGRILKKNGTQVLLNDSKAIKEVRFLGEKAGESDFIESYLLYGREQGHKIAFNHVSTGIMTSAQHGLMAGFRFKYSIDVPGQISPGHCILKLFMTDIIDGLFAGIDIQYPRTPENDTIFNEIASLDRYCDNKWKEVAPFQLKPMLTGPPVIIKHNYQGDLGRYSILDFERADENNKELDSFNHHITAGFTGITDGARGFVLGSDTTVLSSFAFCPMRTRKEGTGTSIFLNPFGTYHGKQRHHKSYGSGLGAEITTAAVPQFKSLAPAYNGSSARFILGIFPFAGDMPYTQSMQKIKVFCSGTPFTSLSSEKTSSIQDNVRTARQNPDGTAITLKRKNVSGEVALGFKLKILLKVLRSALFRR